MMTVIWHLLLIFCINVGRVPVVLSIPLHTLADCPIQPNDINFMHDAMLQEVEEPNSNLYARDSCIFKYFDLHALTGLDSGMSADVLNVQVEVIEFSTVPSAQIYSHCSNCIYEWGQSGSDSEFLCNNEASKNSNNRCFVGYSNMLREGSTNASYSRTSSSNVLTKDSRMLEFEQERYVSTSILVSGSLWSEFFHYDSTDQYRLVINPKSRTPSPVPGLPTRYNQPFPAYMVTNPVFIIPMITFHVGHVLIDVLEQVYQSMIAQYGEVRLDSLLVFDVAGAPEKGILLRKLKAHLYDPNQDVYGILLRLLTRNPVVTINSLQDDEFFRVNSPHHLVRGRSNSILFTDLHIGVDISNSFFYYGYNYHPLSFQQHFCSLGDAADANSRNGAVPLIDQLSSRYRSFRNHLVHGSGGVRGVFNSSLVLSKLNSGPSRHSVHPQPLIEFSHLHALFIHRHDSRIVTNFNDLIVGFGGGDLLAQAEAEGAARGSDSDPCDSTGGIVHYHSTHNVNGTGKVPFEVYNLQHTAFSAQIELFAHTRIFIATAGTSVHNLIFLPPLSAVIIIMQHPSWCKWSWVYSNQAYLLNIYALIYCPKAPAAYKEPESEFETTPDFLTEATSNHTKFDVEAWSAGNVEYYHWTRSFWSQGRRSSKMENITVDIPEFNALYRQAMVLTAHSDSLLHAGENAQTRHYQDTVCRSVDTTYPSTSNSGNVAAPHPVPPEPKSAGINSDSAKQKLLKRVSATAPAVMGLHTHSVKIEPLEGHSGWELSIHGEISIPPTSGFNRNSSGGGSQFRNAAGAGSSQYLFSSFPRLAVCLHSFLIDDHYFDARPIRRVDANGNALMLVPGDNITSGRDRDLLRKYKYYQRRAGVENGSDLYSNTPKYFTENTWCYPVESFNYYAELKLKVSMPLHYFHMWLQSSMSGGKIAGSDAYLMVDCEVPIMFESGPMISTRARKPRVGAGQNVPVKALPTVGVTSADLHRRLSSHFGNLYAIGTVPDLRIQFNFIKVVCSESGMDFLSCHEHSLLFDYIVKSQSVYESVHGSPSAATDKYFVDTEVLRFCHVHNLVSRQCADVFVQVYRELFFSFLLGGDLIPQRDYNVQLPSVPLTQEYYHMLQANEISFQYFEARAHRARQIVPSATHPFVFIHVDKSAGTTLREFIFESALKLPLDDGSSLDVIIPCHGGLHCKNFLMGQHQLRIVPCVGVQCSSTSLNGETVAYHSYENVAVIAGHFSWGAWNHLPALSPSLAPVGRGASAPKSSCLVVGRNPVTRFISYYYQRCFNSTNCIGYHKRLKDLAQEEVDTILWRSRHAEEVDDEWKAASGLFEDMSKEHTFNNTNLFIVVDDGLHDAACRQMLPNQFAAAHTGQGGVESTRGVVLDRMGRFDPARYSTEQTGMGGDEPVTAIPFNYPEELTEADVISALDNVDQCVVGLVEEWALSKKIISYYFPWLQFGDQPDRRKMRLYSDMETEGDLPPWMVEMIRSGNQCDMRLYSKMVWMFENQVHLADHSIFL